MVTDHRFSDDLKELAHGLVKVESLLAQRAKLRGIRNRLRISDLDAVVKLESQRKTAYEPHKTPNGRGIEAIRSVCRFRRGLLVTPA